MQKNSDKWRVKIAKIKIGSIHQMIDRIIFNIKGIIGFLFIILILFFNPISWILLFDKDGEISFITTVYFYLFDFICLLFSYFFISHNNKIIPIVHYLRAVVFNFLFIIIISIFMEIIFGEWIFSNPINHLNLIRNTTYTFPVRNLYPKKDGNIIYKRDKWGFRGFYKDVSNIDILTVGGSTTDQRYISEGYTFQDILRKEFEKIGKNISIVNSGVDGQSTYGHIKNFDLWYNQIPDLKPKYFLFLVGVNDFYKDVTDELIYDQIL